MPRLTKAERLAADEVTRELLYGSKVLPGVDAWYNPVNHPANIRLDDFVNSSADTDLVVARVNGMFDPKLNPNWFVTLVEVNKTDLEVLSASKMMILDLLRERVTSAFHRVVISAHNVHPDDPFISDAYTRIMQMSKHKWQPILRRAAVSLVAVR